MEKLNYKYESARKAGQALKNALTLSEEKYETSSDIEQSTYIASVIKHFELFYEMLWKFFKFYLLEKHGIDTIGSKDVFRALKQKEFINQHELDVLLESVNLRNTASHTYNIDVAIEFCHEVKTMYPVMQSVLDSVSKNI